MPPLLFRKNFWIFFYADLKASSIVTVLIAFILIYYLNGLLSNLIAKYIVPIIIYFERGTFLDFIVISILFIWIFKYIFLRCLDQGLIPSINSLVFGIATIVLYVLFFRENEHFHLTPFQFQEKLHSLKPTYEFYYMDGVIICVLLNSFLYKRYPSIITKKVLSSTLIEDFFDDSEKDLHNRKGSASQIANLVLTTNPQKSFSIAITGRWGAGKTAFLKFLKAAFTAQKFDNVFIVDFNPWRLNQSTDITFQLLTTLAETIGANDKGLIKSIRNYADSLDNLPESKVADLWATIQLFWKPKPSIEKQYQNISNQINDKNYKLLIFIDDVDRLTGTEIFDLLRLIRNTADFPNTFFIVAIDNIYAINAIRKTNHFSNEDKYLEKIFQLEIPLPPIRKSEIKQYLLSRILEKIPFSKGQPSKHSEIVTTIEQLLYEYDLRSLVYTDTKRESNNSLFTLFETIRDVKRFLNSFILSYNNVGDNVVVADLFLLEVVKIKYPQVYHLLSVQTILEKTGVRHKEEFCLINEETFQNRLLEDAKNLSRYNHKIIWGILSQLFNQKGKGSRSIIFVENFYLYFSHQLFNLISLPEFESTRNKNADEIVDQFETWITQRKGDSLNRILDEITTFRDEKEFEKFLEVYLRVEPLNRSGDVYQFLIEDIDPEKPHKYVYGNENFYKGLFERVFSNNKLRPIVKATLANKFLELIIYRKVEAVLFSKNSWQQVIHEQFILFLNSLKKFTNEVFDFYHLNDDYRDTNNRVFLNPAASLTLKAFVSKPEIQESFSRKLIRFSEITYPTQQITEYVFYPFLEDIFGGPNQVVKFLEDLPNSSYKNILIQYYKMTSRKARKFSPDKKDINLILKIMKEEDMLLGTPLESIS